MNKGLATMAAINLNDMVREELTELLLPSCLDNIGTWDVFQMNNLSRGVPITHLLYSLLHDERYCLMDVFDLPKDKVQAFLLGELERGGGVVMDLGRRNLSLDLTNILYLYFLLLFTQLLMPTTRPPTLTTTESTLLMYFTLCTSCS